MPRVTLPANRPPPHDGPCQMEMEMVAYKDLERPRTHFFCGKCREARKRENETAIKKEFHYHRKLEYQLTLKLKGIAQ